MDTDIVMRIEPSRYSPHRSSFRAETAADDTDYTDGAVVAAFIRVIRVIRGFKFLKS